MWSVPCDLIVTVAVEYLEALAASWQLAQPVELDGALA
jgi:hypothetical protein